MWISEEGATPPAGMFDDMSSATTTPSGLVVPTWSFTDTTLDDDTASALAAADDAIQPDTSAVPASLAASPTTWKYYLNGWRFIDQNTVDHGSDVNHVENCGPTCTAMIIWYAFHKLYSPQQILAKVPGYGPNYGGNYPQPTSWNVPQWWLNHLHMKWRMRDSTSKNDMIWWLWRALHGGNPTMGLFSFDAPGSGGHFMDCVGSFYNSAHGVRYFQWADPWLGKCRTMSAASSYLWMSSCPYGNGTAIMLEARAFMNLKRS